MQLPQLLIQAGVFTVCLASNTIFQRLPETLFGKLEDRYRRTPSNGGVCKNIQNLDSVGNTAAGSLSLMVAKNHISEVDHIEKGVSRKLSMKQLEVERTYNDETKINFRCLSFAMFCWIWMNKSSNRGAFDYIMQSDFTSIQLPFTQRVWGWSVKSKYNVISNLTPQWRDWYKEVTGFESVARCMTQYDDALGKHLISSQTRLLLEPRSLYMVEVCDKTMRRWNKRSILNRDRLSNFQPLKSHHVVKHNELKQSLQVRADYLPVANQSTTQTDTESEVTWQKQAKVWLEAYNNIITKKIIIRDLIQEDDTQKRYKNFNKLIQKVRSIQQKVDSGKPRDARPVLLVKTEVKDQHKTPYDEKTYGFESVQNKVRTILRYQSQSQEKSRQFISRKKKRKQDRITDEQWSRIEKKVNKLNGHQALQNETQPMSMGGLGSEWQISSKTPASPSSNIPKRTVSPGEKILNDMANFAQKAFDLFPDSSTEHYDSALEDAEQALRDALNCFDSLYQYEQGLDSAFDSDRLVQHSVGQCSGTTVVSPVGVADLPSIISTSHKTTPKTVITYPSRQGKHHMSPLQNAPAPRRELWRSPTAGQ